MNTKTISSVLAVILAVWLVSCKTNSEQTKITEEAVKVKTQIVGLSGNTESNSYVGTVEESVSVPSSFSTVGQVEKVYVAEGDRVKKGQLLAELNSSNYQNLYQISLAKEKQAEDAYNRLSDLYKKGSLPEIKYIEIQTSLEQAKSSTQIALKNLSDCKLYSPMNGVVGRRNIEPGMNVIPTSTVFDIVKIDKVFVKVSIPENEISKIIKGEKAQIIVAALDNELFEGIVEEKGVLANPLSHTYDIKIAIINTKEKLFPGMVCNVSIDQKATAGLVIIPQQSIQIDENGKKYVYVADAQKEHATVRGVETGILKNNGVVVTNGLQVGEMIIVEGYQRLSENSPIEIVK